MGATITKQVLHDGERNAIVKCHILGDDLADLADQLLIDISADLTMGERTEVRLNRVSADLDGFSARLLWDATTNVPIVELPTGDSDNDYSDIGGLRNDAGAGVTGHIDLTTTGLGAEGGTITLYMKKVEGARKIG